MRIYTNYDGWMMTRHNIKLGTILSHNVLWNLDDESHQLRWVLELIKDDVIAIFSKDASENLPTHVGSLCFIFKKTSLKLFNRQPDGKVNAMQFPAMVRNLKEIRFIHTI